MLATSRHFCNDPSSDIASTRTRRNSVTMGVTSFVKRLSSLRVVSVLPESNRDVDDRRTQSVASESCTSPASHIDELPPPARRPSILQKRQSTRPTSSLSFSKPSQKSKDNTKAAVLAETQIQPLPQPSNNTTRDQRRPSPSDPHLHHASKCSEYITVRRQEELEPITAILNQEKFPTILRDQQEAPPKKTLKKKKGQMTLDHYLDPAPEASKAADKRQRDSSPSCSSTSTNHSSALDDQHISQHKQPRDGRRIHFAKIDTTSSTRSSSPTESTHTHDTTSSSSKPSATRILHIPASASSSRSTSRFSSNPSYCPEDYNIPYISKQMARRITTAAEADLGGAESPYPHSSTDGSDDGYGSERKNTKGKGKGKGKAQASSSRTESRNDISAESSAESQTGGSLVGEVRMDNFPALCLLRDNKEAYEEWMEMARKEEQRA